jgi:hypothetical protein
LKNTLTRKFVAALIVFSLSAGLAACTTDGALSGHEHAMASLDGMPAEVRAAPARVQEAYQFAVTNPELAKQIPCYCGCSALGHTSSYDCYVAGVTGAGELNYDLHAVNCGVCVDITQDTMRLLDAGPCRPARRSSNPGISRSA